MADFFVDIIARDEKVYSGSADYLLLPGWDGETGILHNHAPLISMLKPGICKLKNGDEEYIWAMSEGFASITDNNIKIAVLFAYRPEEIDKELAEETLKQAQAVIETKSNFEDTDEDYLKLLRAKTCLSLVKYE